REVPELREAATDVLDVLVHTEDLLDHEDDGELAAGRRHRAIRGQLTDLHVACSQALRVGGDRACSDGASGEGEARGECSGDENASAQLFHVFTLLVWLVGGVDSPGARG